MSSGGPHGVGRGSLPRGGLPQLPGISTLPDGMEEMLIGSLNSSPKDLRGFAGYNDVTDAMDVHHYTKGEIYVVVDSLAPPTIVVWADIQIVALTQGVPDLLAAAAVNSFTGPLKLSLPNPSAYSTLRVLARQVINGIPSNLFDPAYKLDGRVLGRLYR